MKTLKGKIYDLFDELVLIEDEIAILSNRLGIQEQNFLNLLKKFQKKNENTTSSTKEKEIPLRNGTFGCVSNPYSEAEKWFILIEKEGKFHLIYEDGGYDTIGDTIEDSFNKMGYSQKTGRAISFLVNAIHFDMAKRIKKHYESHCGDDTDTDEDVLFYRN